MGKLIKVVGIGVVVFLLVLIIGAGVALMVIDPNDFRDDIEQLAGQHLDRELTLDGEIELSLFPWIGVQTGGASLSNAASFPATTFASLESIDVKLSLLSLLRGAVVVDTVRLNGLTANLEVNEKGENNWSTLVKTKPDQAPEPVSKPKDGKQGPPVLPELTVQGIEILDAELRWHDAKSGTQAQITNFNLVTGTVTLGQPITLNIDFDVSSNQPSLSGEVVLKAIVDADLERQQYNVDVSNLTIELLGEPLPRGALALTLSAQLSSTASQAAITDLELSMDDTRLTGSASVTSNEPPQIAFSVDVNVLDLDQYLSQPVAEPSPEPQTAAQPLDLKSMLSPLDSLDIRGDLTVGLLKVKNITSTEVQLGVRADRGRLTLSPMDLKLYSGAITGTAVADNRGAVPAFKLQQKLTGVAVGPLLRDFAEIDIISGGANASVSVDARGNNVEQLIAALNGTVSFDVRDGEIKGINVDRAICLARSQLKQLQQKTVRECPDSPDTEFATLAGNAVIKNGVVNNERVSVEQVRKGGTGRLGISGYGTVDLNSQRLDYHVRAARLEATADDPKKFAVRGNEVPVRIRGTFTEFKVRPELSEAMKQKVDVKKQEAEEKAKRKLIKELEVDKDDSDADKAKKDLLKRLFE